MRLPIPLRRRAVLWLLPPAVLLVVLVGEASQTGSPLPGYWTWTVAHSVLLLIVPAAVAATGAALEAARLRTRTLENTTNIRRPVAVLANAIWPSYVSGLLLQAIAIGLVSASAWGGDSAVPWSLLLAIAAVLLFHTTAGFLAGSLMRPTIGIPIALAFSYSWLGFTGTIEWFAPRHLAGLVLETCCFYDQQLDPRSAAATVIFSVLASAAFALMAVSALRLTTARGVRRIGAPSALMVAALVSGLVASTGLSSTAAEPRDADELRCSGGGVVVCLYPEQRALGDPTPEIQQMVQRIADLGIPIPRKVIASPALQEEDEIALRYLPGMTNDQIASSLASSFRADQELVCASEPVQRTIARQEAGDVARAWLTLHMSGGSAADVQGTDLPLFSSLMRADVAEQATWIRAALASLGDCLVDPPGAS